MSLTVAPLSAFQLTNAEKIIGFNMPAISLTAMHGNGKVNSGCKWVFQARLQGAASHIDPTLTTELEMS
jgi:hypothetical protein